MEFKEHLSTYLNEEEINKLMDSLSEESKHCVLLNPKKMSKTEFLKLFPDVVEHPIVDNCFIYHKTQYDLGKHYLHDLGAYYLQEPSAAIPSFLLSPNKGETVLDLCAAPGGKSVQASFLMEDTGVIISNDLSHQRAGKILENVERLGISNIVITNNDFSLLYKEYLNYFDKIILDAPCSGSGMFRKDTKMEEDWSYNKVIKFQEIQKELISYCYKMLKPGGTMVYSTCSFSMEEDEDVVAYLLDNSDASLVEIPQNDKYYISTRNIGVHLLPSYFPGEGHYVALIKKPGVLEISFSEIKENKEFKKIIPDVNYPIINKYGDYLFGCYKQIKSKGLNIIRNGVKIGEIGKGYFKYDHHYAKAITTYPTKLEISYEDLKKYYQGETLNIENKKGYVLLTHNQINVDLAKGDGRIIKNLLPKRLRKLFK